MRSLPLLLVCLSVCRPTTPLRSSAHHHQVLIETPDDFDKRQAGKDGTGGDRVEEYVMRDEMALDNNSCTISY